MFVVYRLEKFKRSSCFGVGLERNRDLHPERNFAKSSIDETQTQNNIVVDGKNERNFNLAVSQRIQKYGVKERPDSTVFVGAVMTASADFFTRNPNYKEPPTDGREDTRTLLERRKYLFDEKAQSFFADCYRFYVQDICKGNSDLIFSAKVDMDETTPHLQIYSVPVVSRTNKKGISKNHLSAKDVFGDRTTMRQRQDAIHEAIGKPRNFERGQKVDWEQSKEERKKHEETHAFKVRKQREELEQLKTERSTISAELQDMKQEKQVLRETLQEQKKVVEDVAQNVDRVINSRPALIPISSTEERKTLRGTVPATQTFKTDDVQRYKEKTQLAPCDRWTLNDVARNIDSAVQTFDKEDLVAELAKERQRSANLEQSLSYARERAEQSNKMVERVLDAVERLCGLSVRQTIEMTLWHNDRTQSHQRR